MAYNDTTGVPVGGVILDATAARNAIPTVAAGPETAETRERLARGRSRRAAEDFVRTVAAARKDRGLLAEYDELVRKDPLSAQVLYKTDPDMHAAVMRRWTRRLRGEEAEPPSMSALAPGEFEAGWERMQRRREWAEDLLGGRGGTGDVDAMLGERMNPLVEAAMLVPGGGPATTAVRSLVADSVLPVATLAGMEKLAENHPRAAQMAQLALAAASLPGLAKGAKSAIVQLVDDLAAEPTEAKINLLYEMSRAAARRRGGTPGAQEASVLRGLQNLLSAEESPKQPGWRSPRRLVPSSRSQGSSRPSHAFYALDDAAKEDLLTNYLEALEDFDSGNTSYRGYGPASREGVLGYRLRSAGEQIPPEVRGFIDGQLANYNGNVHNFFRELTNDERFTGFWDWMGRGGRIPLPRETGPVWTIDNTRGLSVEGSRWYADLVQRYGEERAQAMAQFVSSPDYPDYFLPPGPDGQAALDEISQYASARKIIRDVTEPGEIVIGGSAGINLEGTISRETAVPHDLDFSGYIANASRRTDIPFYLNDGRPLSPQVRNEMYAALSNHENIESAPIIQKLRRLYPELKDAGFRYARYDWEFNGGAQYKPGVFTVVKRPDITEKGNGYVLLATEIDGNNVDIMLGDAKIAPNPVDPRYGSADVAFDWKDYYGWRSKDLRDKADFSRFSQDNPISSAVSGRARFSPSRFADSLITDEGFPVVVDIEQTPGGPTIPMVMNHRGIMLQADDPSLLSMYAKNNPVNFPRFASPADASDKPLAAARVINRVARNQGAQGEAAPSIGVYRADDLQELADRLIQWSGTSDDIVVYRNGATVDPAANLANVLYTENAGTGGPFNFWPAKASSNYQSSGLLRNQELITRALENPTPENLQALGQAFGESTRGFGPMVDRVDNRLRNVLYSRPTNHYAEAKPGRYVPDTEATGVFHASDPDLRDKLIKALSDSRFAVPFLVAAGLITEESNADDEPDGVHLDAKGGDNFGTFRNFLATDEVPESIFGYPVVRDESQYTEGDLEFFRKNPKAAGFYDLGDEELDEDVPQQALDAGDSHAKPAPHQYRDETDPVIVKWESAKHNGLPGAPRLVARDSTRYFAGSKYKRGATWVTPADSPFGEVEYFLDVANGPGDRANRVVVRTPGGTDPETAIQLADYILRHHDRPGRFGAIDRNDLERELYLHMRALAESQEEYDPYMLGRNTEGERQAPPPDVLVGGLLAHKAKNAYLRRHAEFTDVMHADPKLDKLERRYGKWADVRARRGKPEGGK